MRLGASGTYWLEEFKMRVGIISALAAAIGFASPALALDKVTFGTNWVADPEAGGFYQALVDGTYEKYGLDVTILPGGPTSNGGMLLIAGKIEFYMGGDMIGDLLAVQNDIPTVAVAADSRRIRRYSCPIPAWASTSGRTFPRRPRTPAAARSTPSGRGCVSLTDSRTKRSSRTITIPPRSSSTSIQFNRAT